MRSRPIYVEVRMHVPLERIWKHTQTANLHERWDLRFTNIEYLPRAEESEPQRFRYATRIGFGLGIEGGGESVGESTSEESRSSALRFWSDDSLSLIREGSGYWKYVKDGDSVRFLTLYDYRVRFGAIGRLVDAFLFRPIMGWATAWSFDRLRRWLESGQHPESAFRQFAGHALARCAVGFVWLWHGLVPKLVFDHPDEALMLTDTGIDSGLANQLVVAAGIFEVAFGLIVLGAWRWRAPLWITLGLMVLATVGVAVESSRYLTAAFNPVTLNVQLFVLAAIALLLGRDLPTARNCLRNKPEFERSPE